MRNGLLITMHGRFEKIRKRNNMEQPKPDIPAFSRLCRLLDHVGGCPKGTVLSEREAEAAIMGYIVKIETEAAERVEKCCLCCGKEESKWLANEDLAHLYLSDDLCQACDFIICWARDSIPRLETVIAFLRLVEKQSYDS